MKNAAKWNGIVLGGILGILGVIALFTIIIDPFWHYHGPLKGLEYPLKDERYLNDGIARHAEYDAIITGTSMTQNFKPSQFDALWGAKAIKIAFSGATYKEVNDNIVRALRYGQNVKYILRSLDGNKLILPADQDEYEGYPDYLYDNNPFNDVSYLLNKEVIPKTLAVLNYTRAGNKTPDWDEYGSWGQYKVYGKDEVLRTSSRLEISEKAYELTPEDEKNIQENIEKNVLATAKEHPEITFYLFFPPYSISYWDALVRSGQLDAQLRAQKMAVELLLDAQNVHIYAFEQDTSLTGNLDNYTDSLHYGPWINEEILVKIRQGEGELTKENYKEHFETVREIYLQYPYDEVLYGQQ